MQFLRYESFRDYLRLYPVTSLILLINIVLFLLMTISGGSTSSETLIRFGAMVNAPEYNDISGIWRYFASTFLHIGFEHLLFNCFAIFIFAPPLEKMLQKFRYALFYIGCGVLGSVVSNLLSTDVFISAGASGAIYGIYAAYIYMSIFRKEMLDQDSRKSIVIILAVGVMYSLFVPKVNLLAHLGGFLGGLVLFHLLQRR